MNLEGGRKKKERFLRVCDATNGLGDARRSFPAFAPTLLYPLNEMNEKPFDIFHSFQQVHWNERCLPFPANLHQLHNLNR